MKFVITHAENGFVVRTIKPSSSGYPYANVQSLHVFKTLGEVYYYFESVCNEERTPESKL